MVLRICLDSGAMAIVAPRTTPFLARADLQSLNSTFCADMVLESMVPLHRIDKLACQQAGSYMRAHYRYIPSSSMTSDAIPQ